MKKILGLILTLCMLIPILSVTPVSAKQKRLTEKQIEDIIKKEKLNTDKGKLYISRVGLILPTQEHIFITDLLCEAYPKCITQYLNGNKIYGMKVSDFVSKTKYKIYSDYKCIIEINVKNNEIWTDNTLYISNGKNKYELVIDISDDYLLSDSTIGYMRPLSIHFFEIGDPYSDYNCYYYINYDKNIHYCSVIKDVQFGEGFSFKDKNSYLFKKTFSIKKAPSFENFEKDFEKKVWGAGKSLIQYNLSFNEENAEYTVTVPVYQDVNVRSGLGQPVTRNIEIRYVYNKKTRKCVEVMYVWDENIMEYSG